MVSIAVGIILFDSGLDLNIRKLTSDVGSVAFRLGEHRDPRYVAVETIASHALFDLSWQVALVLGAVLVVSGSTVAWPLLAFIRPSKTWSIPCSSGKAPPLSPPTAVIARGSHVRIGSRC